MRPPVARSGRRERFDISDVLAEAAGRETRGGRRILKWWESSRSLVSNADLVPVRSRPKMRDPDPSRTTEREEERLFRTARGRAQGESRRTCSGQRSQPGTRAIPERLARRAESGDRPPARRHEPAQGG